MKIDIVDRAPVRVAYLRYTGPFGEGLNRFWRNTVAPWLATHELLDCPRFGVSVDDPTHTPPDRCRYDACVELPPGWAMPDFAETTLEGGLYAVTCFKGRSTQIGESWTAFVNSAIARGFARDPRRPLFEHFPRGATYDHRTGAFGCELCIPITGADENLREHPH